MTAPLQPRPVQFQGGRLPDDRGKPRLQLVPHILELHDTPPAVDYLSGVLDWPMYGNDRCGDCTIATVGHALQAISTYGTGAELRLTDDEILAKYSALSGYDPRTGANDNGLYVQDVLNDWRTTGYAAPDGSRHQALAFAWVNPQDLDAVRWAIDVFGWVYLGITVTQSAMDQFNRGQAWESVPSPGPVLGGHAIPCGRFDTARSVFEVVTWGQRQEMTEAFWRQCVEECWVIITPEWLNAAGASPPGLDLYGLGQDFAELTGEPNPFPAPAPPEPQPPAPGPAPPSPDRALADELHSWLGRSPWFYKKTQAAARRWLDAKGLR